jgi:coenzyme F420-reducing hydrogenase beta subunit
VIICDKEICTGCGACYSVCPTKCISMEYNSEGFLFPIVDDESCIKCYKCRETCPSLNLLTNTNEGKPITIGCWHKNEDTVKMSSSGGAFSAIAEYIFENKGVVIGCTMDEILTPHHILVSNYNDLKLIRGSKYIQSEIRDVYIKTKELLDKEIKVLFTGCPCQVAGLYAYLKDKDYGNLITVDLVCHGVGSKTFFDKYIDEMNDKYKDKITGLTFRSKEKTGKKYVTKLSFLNRSSIYIPAVNDSYMSCYLQRAIYRESCYSCKYASLPRVADITIGDFVGIDRGVVSKEDYHNGISVILLNNKKGIEYFDEFKRYLNWIERPLEEATSTNLNIYEPSKLPNSREKIFSEKGSIKEIKNKYCKFKLRVHIANILGDDVTRYLKILLRK